MSTLPSPPGPEARTATGRPKRRLRAPFNSAAPFGAPRSALHLIVLLQCLHQATHPWRSSLCTLPSLSPAHVAQLEAAGVECLPQLLERSDKGRVLACVAREALCGCASFGCTRAAPKA